MVLAPSHSVQGYAATSSIPSDYKDCDGTNDTPDLANLSSPVVKWIAPNPPSGNECPPIANMVVQCKKDGTGAPSGWSYCDGTGGTPDLPETEYSGLEGNIVVAWIWFSATSAPKSLPARSIVRFDESESIPSGWVACDGDDATPIIPDETTTGDVTLLRYIMLT